MEITKKSERTFLPVVRIVLTVGQDKQMFSVIYGSHARTILDFFFKWVLVADSRQTREVLELNIRSTSRLQK